MATRTQTCAACNTSAPAMKRCGACHYTTYCNQACQRNDWPTHRSECPDILDAYQTCMDKAQQMQDKAKAEGKSFDIKRMIFTAVTPREQETMVSTCDADGCIATFTSDARWVCDTCKTANYCSLGCREHAAPTHQTDCDGMRRETERLRSELNRDGVTTWSCSSVIQSSEGSSE